MCNFATFFLNIIGLLPGRRAAGLRFSYHPNSFAAMCLSVGRTDADGVGPAAFSTLKPLPPPRRSQMKVRGKGREKEAENQQREGRQSRRRRQIKRSGGSEGGGEAVATVSQIPPSSLSGTISRRSLLLCLSYLRPSRQFYDDDRTLSAKAIMVGFLALASLCLAPSSSLHLPWESGSRESSACNADEFPSVSVITVSAASSDQ